MNNVTVGILTVTFVLAAFFIGIVVPVGDSNDACRTAAELGGRGMIASIENTDSALSMAQEALDMNFRGIDRELSNIESGQDNMADIIDDYVTAANECGLNVDEQF